MYVKPKPETHNKLMASLLKENSKLKEQVKE